MRGYWNDAEKVRESMLPQATLQMRGYWNIRHKPLDQLFASSHAANAWLLEPQRVFKLPALPSSHAVNAWLLERHARQRHLRYSSSHAVNAWLLLAVNRYLLGDGYAAHPL